MVVYLDLAFLVSGLADTLALYVTGCLGGWSMQKKRLLLAGVLGGLYGAMCALPMLSPLTTLPVQLASAAGLVWLAFGKGGCFWRRWLLFLLLSCTMGGVLLTLTETGRAEISWGSFFLAGGSCYLLLSVVFRHSGQAALSGQLRQMSLMVEGRSVTFTALLDTGHTLTEQGRAVCVVEVASLLPLLPSEEGSVIEELATQGVAVCMSRLAELAPTRYRLLPYQAVGVHTGVLLCFTAEQAQLGKRELGNVTVAISPTSVSNGGGYTALWSGEEQ